MLNNLVPYHTSVKRLSRIKSTRGGIVIICYMSQEALPFVHHLNRHPNLTEKVIYNKNEREGNLLEVILKKGKHRMKFCAYSYSTFLSSIQS